MGAAVRGPVDLHHDAGPAEVPLEPLEAHVHERLRQLVHEREERVLRRAARPRAPARMQFQGALDDPQPRPPPHPRHRVPDRRRDEPPAKRGLVHHVRELMRREHVRQVDDRAVHRRHGNAAMGGAIDHRRAMEPDPGSVAALARDDHVDHRHREPAHVRVLRCGEPRERRALPAAQHGREPTRLARKRVVPHGIDARADAVELATPHAFADRAVRQAERTQLRGRDEAVLPRRDVRERRTSVTKLACEDGFVTHVLRLGPTALWNKTRL